MGQFSYSEQLAVIGKVRVRDGQTFRGNCPFCGGRNTFSITRHGDSKVWNCYRVSCGVTGGIGGGDSLRGIQRKLDGISDELNLPEIPLLSPIENQPAAIKWLDTMHSLEAYESSLIDIKYAPVEDRILFAVKGGLGWAGRARKGVRPKWRKYGDTSGLLTVGGGSTAVLVEDACSACAVGILPEYIGCSLLGTSLSQAHIMELRKYDKVLVCLDPDAAMKALSMVRRIQGTVPCSLKIIPNDLKYYDKGTIRGILNADDTGY